MLHAARDGLIDEVKYRDLDRVAENMPIDPP
jgi:hypothetical protein